MSLDVLFVGDEMATASLAPALRHTYAVSVTARVDTARQFLQRVKPALVILDLDVTNSGSASICGDAKRTEPPSMVLVTTGEAERVPEALEAGCDGVLLKPFLPNLFYARVGRLLRQRSAMLLARSHYQMAKAEHLSARSSSIQNGTNRVWPNQHCPHCNHAGVTSFEYAVHRRAWYACLSCRQVWLAKCQE